MAVQQYLKTTSSFCADGTQIVTVFVEKEFLDLLVKV